MIDVFHGDNPTDLTECFLRKHGAMVNERSRAVLEQEIRRQMESLNSFGFLSYDANQD